MKRKVRWLMVPQSFLYAAVFVYAIVVGIIHLIVRRIHSTSGLWETFVQEGTQQLYQISLVILCIWGAFYGVYRAFMHPVRDINYWKWLANSPWRPELPLPVGPVHLVWQDLLHMAVLGALAEFVSRGDPALPIACILAAYVAVSTANLFATDQHLHGLALATIFPATWYFWPYIWPLLGILAVMYLIVWHGLNLGFRSFPWTLENKLAKSRLGPADKSTPAWPFDRLNGKEPAAPIDGGAMSVICALAGWYLFSFLHCIDVPDWRDARGTAMSIAVGGCVIAFFRLVHYAAGRVPPIHLFARLWLGKLILPKYDRIFVAPILISLTAIGGAALCWWMGIYPPLAAAIMTMIVLGMTLGLGPSMRNWQLTGQYRMVVLKRTRAQ